MLDTIVTTITEHQLLPAQGQVIVAVSGGADSLCLLHILHGLCGPGKLFPAVHLHVAHLDHQLRGSASTQDAAAVSQIAQAWQLPCTIGTCDVLALAQREHRSLEDAARTARYHFLRSLAQGQPIAVAHHMDDQVETLLLHWIRGGGLASMVGLQPRQQDIIRPLLSVTHAQTVAYCAEHHLTPLEDASNSDTRFFRNRIRHELLPLLETMNPGFRETLLRNAFVMQVDLACLEEQVDQHWSNIVTLEQSMQVQLRVHALTTLPLSLQRHLLRRVSARLGAGQSALELRHYRLIEELIHRDETYASRTLHLPNQVHVTRTGDILVFKHMYIQEQPAPSELLEPAEAQLSIPGSAIVPGTTWTAIADIVPEEVLQHVYPALQRQDWNKVWSVLPSAQYSAYVDADKLRDCAEDLQELKLYVRTRRDGDRLQPLGMARTKKVQDILIDKHIPREERAQIPLFFSAQHCVWLAGVYIDDRVRLTSKTQKIVHLSIIQNTSD
jgi:tRNA(Ile)-lysidine synthase